MPGELPGRADLYECDITESSDGCTLHDLSGVAVGSGEGADVQGDVLGVSDDGSRVYFVANGALSEDATPGECHEDTPAPGVTCNLYMETAVPGAGKRHGWWRSSAARTGRPGTASRRTG